MLKDKLKKAMMDAMKAKRSVEKEVLRVALGDKIRGGQELGVIADPFGSGGLAVLAPHDGLVVGHTNNPLVHRGDGILHLASTSPK